MSIAAKYLLHTKQDELDWLTRSLLPAIGVLDEYGAWEWNLRLVGVYTFLFLFSIRLTVHRYRGVEWYALLHAIASSVGAAMCIYLDWKASGPLSGIDEPLRSVQCHPPLTSLHRILPAVTMGYALFDLVDGLFISIDFVLHGAATFAVMILFVERNATSIMAPMLIMETSTIFLNLVKADFFTDTMSILNQFCFAVSFFLCRLVVFPILWGDLVLTMWREQGNVQKDGAVFLECYGGISFMGICMTFGMFYNVLNLYWFRKIVRKVRRRLQGQEKHNERNDLAEAERLDDSTDNSSSKTPLLSKQKAS